MHPLAQNEAGSVVFELPFDARSVLLPKLSRDFGLNQQVTDIVNGVIGCREPRFARVYMNKDISVRGDWGYLTLGDGTEHAALMYAAGWGSEHFKYYAETMVGDTSEPEVLEIDRPAINILWPGVHTYGHWLLDTIPRLYMLECAGIDLSGCVALLPKFGSFYMKEILSIFGIRSCIEITNRRRISCRELYTPTSTRTEMIWAQPHSSIAQALFRERMRRRFATMQQRGANQNRFYVQSIAMTSAAIDPRKLSNEQSIEAIAARQGFKVVNPATMSLLQQFELFSSANAICGIDSSALHNVIFAEPGSVERLIVFSPPWRLNANHVTISAFWRIELSMLAGQLDPVEEGRFTIPEEMAEQCF